MAITNSMTTNNKLLADPEGGRPDTALPAIPNVSNPHRGRGGCNHRRVIMKKWNGKERRKELRSPSWYRWLVKNLKEKEK